jgi:hypothetical protein
MSEMRDSNDLQKSGMNPSITTMKEHQALCEIYLLKKKEDRPIHLNGQVVGDLLVMSAN